jgi:hypothetical protein
LYGLYGLYFAANLLQNVRFIVKYAVYCGLIAGCVVCCKLITGCTVCCKLIAKCVVCRNLLADVANLLRNARFVRFAKDHIWPPRLYGSPQTATNRNNQPQKKIPDEVCRPHYVQVQSLISNTGVKEINKYFIRVYQQGIIYTIIAYFKRSK